MLERRLDGAVEHDRRRGEDGMVPVFDQPPDLFFTVGPGGDDTGGGLQFITQFLMNGRFIEHRSIYGPFNRGLLLTEL